MSQKHLPVFLAATICAASLSLSIPASQAVDVTFAFQGVVTSYSNNVSPSTIAAIPLGSSVTGTYSFESSTLDADPGNPTNGDYFNALTALNFSVNGGSSVTLDPIATNRYILVDDTTTVGDAYFVAADVIGNVAPGVDSDLFSIQLTDPSGTAFTSDALPLSPPSLVNFPATIESIFFVVNQSQFVKFRLSSLTLVPEPTTATLLVGGLLFGLSRRERGRRKCGA